MNRSPASHGSAAAAFAFFLTTVLAAPGVAGKEPKLTPKDVVQKHLESLGGLEAVQKHRTRIVNGTARATVQIGGAGSIEGKVSILSAGQQVRVGMVFPSNDYPGEQLAYDGNRVSAGTLSPGVRSALSAFVYQNDTLLKEGILGGALSTAWPLQSMDVRQPKLSYEGLKKVEGKQCHALKYRPRKGRWDVDVVLYFEPETFRHVRTETKLVIGAAMVSNINESARQQETRHALIEEYGDFREEEGVVLPHTYRLEYSALATGRSFLTSWALAFEQFAANQEIQPSHFSVQ